MWFTSVGVQALKLCSVELFRLICWVIHHAEEPWAFPKGKCWKRFLYGKHFHYVESIWQDQSTTCNFGRSAIPQEKGERSGQENTFKLPNQIQSLFQEGAERGQKKYPSKFSPHVKKAPEFGRQDPCYKSYGSNTLQTWISQWCCKSGVAIIIAITDRESETVREKATHQRTWDKKGQRMTHLRLDPSPIQC